MQDQDHRLPSWQRRREFYAVARGLVQFKGAFLPHLELPGGTTVYQVIAPPV